MYLQNFIDRDAPDAIKDAVRRETAAQQVFVADDYEANHVAASARRGGRSPQQPMRYSLRVTDEPSDWPGPGIFFRRHKR